MSPSISVVIVTYNSAHLIESCLTPLAGAGIEVIVVDNASTDDIELSLPPDVTFVQNRENLGFARAVNIGMRLATQRYILLLNPDARISRESLIKLEAIMDANPGFDAVAPFLRHPQDRLKIATVGNYPTAWNMFKHFSGLSRASRFGLLEGHYLLATSRKPREVQWASGACLMVRKSSWDNVGGMSERWFMYAEDIDLCLRFQRRGGIVWYDPTIVAEHSIAASTSTGEQRINTTWILSLYDYYKLHHAGGRRLLAVAWKFVTAAGLMSRAVVFAAKGRVAGDRSPWKLEARRFRTFTCALLRASSRTEGTPTKVGLGPRSY